MWNVPSRFIQGIKMAKKLSNYERNLAEIRAQNTAGKAGETKASSSTAYMASASVTK